MLLKIVVRPLDYLVIFDCRCAEIRLPVIDFDRKQLFAHPACLGFCLYVIAINRIASPGTNACTFFDGTLIGRSKCACSLASYDVEVALSLIGLCNHLYCNRITSLSEPPVGC